jgi:hypothetical protein
MNRVEQSAAKDQNQHQQNEKQRQQETRDGGKACGQAGEAQQSEDQSADGKDDRPSQHR